MAAPKTTDINRLQFHKYHGVLREVDLVTGVETVERMDYVIFYALDDDDRLELGSVTFPQGFPIDSTEPPVEDNTFEMVEGLLTAEQVKAALRPIPDENIYVKLPLEWPVTVAGEPTSAEGLYLKRFGTTKCFRSVDNPVDRTIVTNLICDEVRALQLISQHPAHPNIIKYHGCRVRRGFITAIVMDRVDGETLEELVREGRKVYKAAFMTSLRSAITHLHSVVGVAHNDLNPSNIMVGKDGMPVLIDFGSTRPLGRKMGMSHGTPGWVEYDIDDKGVDRRSEGMSIALKRRIIFD